MKRSLAIFCLAIPLALASCGSGEKMAETARSNDMAVEENYGDYAESNDETAQEEDISDQNSDTDFKQSEVKTINRQMLVYSCDMSIDVMEFDDSVDKFHGLIDKYQGFIESETYSDGGSSSQWKYADEQKWKTLNALIRIPSADYENFCKDAENIGDLRKKNASVQNLTTEYSDLKTTLKIYEAKEKRYIDLLSEIKDENEAMAVEKELTELQIDIARIKTRMNSIENDVAYSYINITLNEVREYTEKPKVVETDTFGQRLKNTLTDTAEGFLDFLENLLFFIIRVLPYAVILGIVMFFVIKIKRALKPRKRHLSTPPNDIPPVVVPDEPKAEEPAAENTESTEKTEE